NGTAAGGGYELALACDDIVLIDDGSSTVSLPEVPLLGVLPGTGGLTRVVDKRHVRRDRADLFATKSEGYRGSTAVEWGLVDITVAGPDDEPPADAAAALEQGVDWWPMAVARALDDLVLRLRTNEGDLGTWVFRTTGDLDRVLAHNARLTELAGSDWFANEVA